MPKQISSMPPIYRGTDKDMAEWMRNLVTFLNSELLKLSGQLNDIEGQVVDIQARMTAHGI